MAGEQEREEAERRFTRAESRANINRARKAERKRRAAERKARSAEHALRRRERINRREAAFATTRLGRFASRAYWPFPNAMPYIMPIGLILMVGVMIFTSTTLGVSLSIPLSMSIAGWPVLLLFAAHLIAPSRYRREQRYIAALPFPLDGYFQRLPLLLIRTALNVRFKSEPEHSVVADLVDAADIRAINRWHYRAGVLTLIFFRDKPSLENTRWLCRATHRIISEILLPLHSRYGVLEAKYEDP
jgi:hypothetical protein